MTEKLILGGGDIYEGEVKDGKPHGKGKIIKNPGKTNELTYEGDFVDGHFHGKGKLKFSNGEIYEGDFVNGSAHGKGKLTSSYGDVYEGGWSNGNKSGRCKYTYANGNVYEGDWEGENANGKGKMTLANGSVYEGDFVDGSPNGEGKEINSDGTVKKGKWKNGEFKGLFGFSSSSGSYGEPYGVIISIIISGVISLFGAAYFGGFLEKLLPYNATVIEIAVFVPVFILCMITCLNERGWKIIKLAVIIVAFVAAGILGNKVLANKSPKPQTTETTQGANTNPSAEITKNVNFRKGPSTNDAVIRQLKQGDIVILTGEVSGGWTQITHNGDTGWVSTEYLKVWGK